MDRILQKRIPRRARVLLNAVIASGGAQQDVRIRDLSLKGALLEMANPLARGTELVLAYGDSSVTCRVAWHDEALVGVEFREPLKGALVALADSRRLRISAPKSYRHDRMLPTEVPLRTGGRVISMRKPPQG